MRLHRLAITGFGPFAGSELIDLDSLAFSGLFLIHGPTGAGKTSVLDAICFALYAAVPGARAGARASLRSDHAAQGVVPEVTLEFTAAGRRLRVCRSPEFSRPKKRGTGETTVPAKVVLMELVGSGWVDRGTRNDEVALVLRNVLGMGLEQFIKVVLLPQGDFAAFLRASPDERRSVLEKLFDTSRFTDVETWLGERRRQTATAVGTARGQLATGLLRVDDVLTRLDDGDDIIAPPWSELSHREVDTVLSGLVRAVDTRASTALAGVEVARARVAHTESAVHHGTAVIRNQQTAADARARLAALDEQRGAYQDALQTVDLAERAGGVSGFVAAVEKADLMREAALAKVANLRAPLAPIVDPGAQTEPALGVGAEQQVPVACIVDPGAESGMVLSLIDRVSVHSDALQQAVAQAAHAGRLAAESAGHRRAALADDKASAAFALQRSRTDARQAAAEKSRDAGRTARCEIPTLETRHKNLSRVQQLLGDQDRSAVILGTLQRQADSADRLLLDARERLVNLRERRLAGLAAELAGGLGAGDACPVCGSCAHPLLATTSDVVSPQDIRSAEADQTRATEALSLVRSKISAELARRDARDVELTAQEPMMAATDIPDALAAVAAARADARVAVAALPEAQVHLEVLALDVERLRGLHEQAIAAKASSLAVATTTHAQSQTAGTEVARLLASHGQSCPCRSGDRQLAEVNEPAEGATQTEVTAHTDVSVLAESAEHAEMTALTEVTEAEVTEVVLQHRLTLTDLRSLATGLQDLATHQANAGDAALRLSTALQDNGLVSVHQAKAAALTPARIAELTAFLRATEQQRAQATALLAQAEVRVALNLPSPDADALAAAHTLAAASLTHAGRRHTLTEQAQRDLGALSGTVHQAVADLEPAEDEAQVIAELADCVAGNSADNALRMRLSSYVLAARLGEIATLANERLGTMSDGRYTLEYTDARAARGARSGLGLMVRDAWTGTSRVTSSLSGGESFMASLALALGLGDAVRAEAGGFDLQTLFVDEGFGSLDEDSLEQVMAVLDTLREGGRAVGIVSHVTELRARIPQQLHVIKAQAGSRIRVELGATTVA